MIAHRGGFDHDNFGENSISNINFTVKYCKNFDIEIDIHYIKKKYIVCHDVPNLKKLFEYPTLEEILKILIGTFKNYLFLDIKSKINIHDFFDLLLKYRIKYKIHSFLPEVTKLLFDNKKFLPFNIDIGFASDKGKIIEADYLVFPKNIFSKTMNTNTNIPIYWYTFSKAKDAKLFLKNVPKNNDCFIDYCCS